MAKDKEAKTIRVERNSFIDGNWVSNDYWITPAEQADFESSFKSEERILAREERRKRKENKSQ